MISRDSPFSAFEKNGLFFSKGRHKTKDHLGKVVTLLDSKLWHHAARLLVASLTGQNSLQVRL